jgi:hypothetical protein
MDGAIGGDDRRYLGGQCAWVAIESLANCAEPKRFDVGGIEVGCLCRHFGAGTRQPRALEPIVTEPEVSLPKTYPPLPVDPENPD